MDVSLSCDGLPSAGPAAAANAAAGAGGDLAALLFRTLLDDRSAAGGGPAEEGAPPSGRPDTLRAGLLDAAGSTGSDSQAAPGAAARVVGTPFYSQVPATDDDADDDAAIEIALIDSGLAVFNGAMPAQPAAVPAGTATGDDPPHALDSGSPPGQDARGLAAALAAITEAANRFASQRHGGGSSPGDSPATPGVPASGAATGSAEDGLVGVPAPPPPTATRPPAGVGAADQLSLKPQADPPHGDGSGWPEPEDQELPAPDANTQPLDFAASADGQSGDGASAVPTQGDTPDLARLKEVAAAAVGRASAPVAFVDAEQTATNQKNQGDSDRRFGQSFAAPDERAARSVAALHLAQAAGGFDPLLRSAAAPVSDARPVSLPDEAGVASSIVESMRVQMRDGVGTAVVHLEPDYLGAVSIAIRVEDGVVTATLHADNPQVRAWMEANEPMLRDGLAAQNLSLDRLVITHEPLPEGRPSGGRNPQQQDQAPRQQRPRRQDRNTFEVIV